MTNQFLMLLFGLPSLTSLVVALLLRHRPTAAHKVTLLASAGTALCALALLPFAGRHPTVVIEWLPGTGPISFGLGVTSLGAALVTTWAAFFVLLGTASVEREKPALSQSVMLLALVAANVAFFTEHFLARYVALEVVALCIALAPLTELSGDEGSRAFWLVYLILRLGDAGLLSAILILFDATGTLQISPAIEAAGVLGPVRLGWALFGFLLAVWVKLGNWPFHIWARYGRPLKLSTQAWLFAIVMPNLGGYLLYRVTPMLMLSSTMELIALWLGAGVALLSVLLALTRRSLRSALVYVSSARGGLLVFAAVSGTGMVAWLVLVATTPLQVLLLLAGETPERGMVSVQGRAAQTLFGLAGVGMVAVGLLVTYWARQATAPLDAVLVTETATALLGVWAVREATRPPRGKEGIPSAPGRWAAMGAVGLVSLSGAVAFGRLAQLVVGAAGGARLSTPTLVELLRYIVTAPALLLTVVLVLAAWWLRRSSGVRVLAPAAAEVDETTASYDVEEALVQAARALHAVVEVGFLEQFILLLAQIVIDGALLAHRLVEQEGLEGLIRRTLQGVLGLGRITKRLHTGVLRHNLLWIPLSLMLTVIVALIYW